MAHIGGDEGGREINVELNLVPFIDLMSVCIIFLLITAVFTQVSMIQIGSSIYSKQQESQQDVPPPPDSEKPFMLNVKANGYEARMGKMFIRVPKIDDKYDDVRLLEALKNFKAQNPKSDSAMVNVEDKLSFENLIRAMDLLLMSGFSEVAIGTGEEG